ncbi:MAG TPA: hypothetical protein VNT26_07380, partial [Candidatus Sulfotelmatobacter sp.]|nr:hypothetical protein [Candidatus Sulfotelmatobacter sp.]
MNKLTKAKQHVAVLLAILVISWMSPIPVNALSREVLTGKRPQALTPFADDDPVPKLEVQPHAQL